MSGNDRPILSRSGGQVGYRGRYIDEMTRKAGRESPHFKSRLWAGCVGKEKIGRARRGILSLYRRRGVQPFTVVAVTQGDEHDV
jgi:hypothetical protein